MSHFTKDENSRRFVENLNYWLNFKEDQKVAYSNLYRLCDYLENKLKETNQEKYKNFISENGLFERFNVNLAILIVNAITGKNELELLLNELFKRILILAELLGIIGVDSVPAYTSSVYSRPGYYGSGYYGSGYANIRDIQFKNEYFKFIDQLSLHKKSNADSTPLKGIDKVFIISLKGSIREKHIIEQLKKIGLNEGNRGTKWDFINPINFSIGDLEFKDLIDKGILPFELENVSEELKINNEYRKGTVSLSLITYYLFTLAMENGEIYLILEDNIEFVDDFVNKFNTFYDNLPNDDWNILDLHSFNNIKYDNNCQQYYSIKKEKLNIENDVSVPTETSLINNTTRLKINDNVLLGCNEGAGTKAYVIRPTSGLLIESLPIKNPSDGIKNWISGWWRTGISYVPSEELIKVSTTLLSDRRSVDSAESTSTSTYIKLEKTWVDEIINRVKKFNSLQQIYIYELFGLFNKSSRVSIINNIKDNIICNDLNINFSYHDLTNNLSNIRVNANAKKLEETIKKYYIDFNIQKYFKLNPSIVKLNENTLLLCYRIYLGELTCDQFTLDKCHPWKRMWNSNIFEYQPHFTKLNHVGLARINISDMTVLEDTILMNIDDKPLGMEDCRLFENKGKIYLNGAMTTGDNEEGIGQWKDNRTLRQVIIDLGTPAELLNRLPSEKKEIRINCINSHTSIIEKNWFGYNKNGQNILMNPTYPSFLPIRQYNLELDNFVDLDDEFKKSHYNEFKDIKAIKCSDNVSVQEINFIKNLNDIYRDLTNNNEDLFRLSGGSWGVDLSEDLSLFVGHIVVYIDNLDNDKVKAYIRNNKNSIISNNLYQFLFNRKHQLTFYGKTMRYFQILFTLNKRTNKLEKLSHGFSIYESKEKETGVNFPMGLVKINDLILLSYGESDYKTIIIKMNISEVNKLLNVPNYSDLLFLSYDKNANLICYKEDEELNRKYYLKYQKYKNKYLNLKLINNNL